MKIYNSITELIGKTPLVRLEKIENLLSADGILLAKLEKSNPAGSAKDRAALYMIEDAEKRGILKSGSVIVEPTSGNTGIGLAAVAAYKGYEVILTMPDTMSIERQKLLSAYGAKIVLTDGKDGMKGAVDEAKKIALQTGGFLAGQFDNPANIQAHFETTGPEIFEDTDGKVDFFVAGIGTGGSISGVGKFLKQKNPGIKIIGVEPASSPLISKGVSGKHDLQGIGANFIPENYDKNVVDEIFTVSDEDAYETGRLLATKEGLLVGITSGASVFAASKILSRPENKGKTAVAFLPDTGERYLSTKMFL